MQSASCFARITFLWVIYALVIVFMLFGEFQVRIEEKPQPVPIQIITTSSDEDTACKQNFDKILEYSAQRLENSRLILLTYFGDQSIPLEILNNQIASFKNLPFVAIEPRKDIVLSKHPHISCFRDPFSLYQNKYAQILVAALKIVEKGYDALFLDWDSVITGDVASNVFQLFLQHPSTQLWIHQPPVSHGIFLMKASNHTAQLISHIISRIQDNNEEQVWTETLKLLPVLPFKIDYKYLPQEEYSHWSIYLNHTKEWNPVVVRNFMEPSLERFRYRLLETRNWFLLPEGYWNGKFMTYGYHSKENFPFVSNFDFEANSFLNALAISFLLNRTLVLPKFSCMDTKLECTLDDMLDVGLFMEHFGDRIRESSFVENPQFPDKKASIFIAHEKDSVHPKGLDSTLHKIALTPKDLKCGMTDRDTRMITEKNRPVFEFPTLYGRFKKFDNVEQEHVKLFLQKVKKGISWRIQSTTIATDGCQPWWT